MRALGIAAVCYDRLLGFFRSPALNVQTLTRLWTALVVNLHPGLVMCNGRYVLVGDGIKIGEAGVALRVWSRDLPVRFVAVVHPTRGCLLLMTTDLTLAPLEVIRLYGYRFKIEVSFKGALHVVGAFLYHFWMRDMPPITRKAKDQYLHRKSAAYRDAVRRKIDAYHHFIHLGLIAQSIMLALATTVPQLVWAAFGSWMRTIRPGIVPSEAVVACALRNTLSHFPADNSPDPDLAKFIQRRLDRSGTQAQRLAA